MSSKPAQQQGKGFLGDYRSVNERIREFYKLHPSGRIVTSLLESLTNIESGVFVVRTELYRAHEDPHPFATGLAIETPTSGYVNKQGFALENAETSSIGRALQNAGIATKASDLRPEEIARMERASFSEPPSIRKVESQPADDSKLAPRSDTPATKWQKDLIIELGGQLVELGVYESKKQGWSEAVSSTVTDDNPEGKPRLDDWSEAEAAYLINKWTELKRKEEKRKGKPHDDGIC